MSLNFCSLSSGSSGNCYYIGNGFQGILIDAGISATSIRRFLGSINVSLQTIMAVFISHNHSDHIKGLEVLIRKNHIPVFTTENIWKSISPRNRISSDCVREIPLEQIVHLAGFDIEVFKVSHDAPETIGFHISFGDKKITIATDLGYICQTSAKYIKEANLLVIESNYDEELLTNGGYPEFLKARIKSDKGHLANHQSSEFLAGIINEGLSHICLAHLSKNNNTPEHALATLENTLRVKGIITENGPKIVVLKRNVPSEMITIGN